MPVKASYVIWNNKGGVGKSTISFHLATRYAELNPDVNVLVIDMCPQANLSMMLLGGGIGRDTDDVVGEDDGTTIEGHGTTGEDNVLNLCNQQNNPPTLVGYMAHVLSQGAGAPLPNWEDFVVRPSDYNERISGNIYLLCGDGNLEPMAPLITERANQAPINNSPWRWVHLLIRRFIENVSVEGDWLVIIDTNPSFSIYTEIAISSADRLIVPVNADDASRVASSALFDLIWGTNPPHPIYGRYTYASRADSENIDRPSIHLIIGNRLTQNRGAAAAFAAMSDATSNSLFSAFRNHLNRFTANQIINDEEDFRRVYSTPLRDFNTAGVVAAHWGMPISQLRDQYYDVHGERVRVNRTAINECSDAIDMIVNRL